MSPTRPFELHVPDEELADLGSRLARFRALADSPRRPPSGMTGEYLNALVDS
ncbi:hypothetical protein [Microbacterium allomyrinae]|uniref:hypothetical protein n=1 Tax=Microbacterium allomyrinae TaxID=2830666 RepID=UPI001E30A9C6|nr:hypothetical protein [Microbacterium allomyrinae]